jgi:uncharacterized protein YkwD
MNRRAVFFAAWISISLLPAIAMAQASPSPNQKKMLDLVNRERQAAGLPRLQWDPHLAESARTHARLLVARDELSHQLPGEPELASRVAATGLRFNSAGENLAFAPTVEEAHDGLMKSPHHRENILGAEYNAVGIAILPGHGELYFAQNFAHVLPVYSETQFLSSVISAINQIRRAGQRPPLQVQEDRELRKAACNGTRDLDGLMKRLPGTTDMVEFTAAAPEDLPTSMKRTASSKAVRTMKVGVCYAPDQEHGFARFRMVAAFF